MPEDLDGRERTILDSINEGVFTVDLQWHITAFNRAAEQITKVSHREAMGRQCCDVFRANICDNASIRRRTITVTL
jgi:PAS domain S-box-containing protein